MSGIDTVKETVTVEAVDAVDVVDKGKSDCESSSDDIPVLNNAPVFDDSSSDAIEAIDRSTNIDQSDSSSPAKPDPNMMLDVVTKMYNGMKPEQRVKQFMYGNEQFRKIFHVLLQMGKIQFTDEDKKVSDRIKLDAAKKQHANVRNGTYARNYNKQRKMKKKKVQKSTAETTQDSTTNTAQDSTTEAAQDSTVDVTDTVIPIDTSKLTSKKKKKGKNGKKGKKIGKKKNVGAARKRGGRRK